MDAKVDDFFKLADGTPVKVVTLQGRDGTQVSLSSFGATIVRFLTPDMSGQLSNIVLGFRFPASYLRNSSYLGSTIGRFANRISHGQFSFRGKHYTLPLNHGPHHLHGGFSGFSHRNWHIESIESSLSPSVTFSLSSHDGDQGYPGNLDVKVTFTLEDGTSLVIDYAATSDSPTIVSLTDHSYFNLSGGLDNTIDDHVLSLDAEFITKVRSDMIPNGELLAVKGTSFDFTKSRRVGDILLDQKDSQLAFGFGLDHNFVLSNEAGVRLAATLSHPKTGRGLKVYTDKPGIQVYTANFLHEDDEGAPPCSQLRPRSGICLETQHFPDAPNIPSFSLPTTPYHYRTVYQPFKQIFSDLQ